MYGDEADDGGREAALRWIVQQVARSVENLEDLDLELIARTTGLDPERVRGYLDLAGRWLADQAEGRSYEVLRRFGSFIDSTPRAEPSRPKASHPGAGAPHPLDLPTSAQGVALSALDSGRWTVEPGSPDLTAHGGGPLPGDASALVDELRARDWINAAGEVTVVGRSALTRWMEHNTTT